MAFIADVPLRNYIHSLIHSITGKVAIAIYHVRDSSITADYC